MPVLKSLANTFNCPLPFVLISTTLIICPFISLKIICAKPDFSGTFYAIVVCSAKGFGAGNFKALFESIEREQAKRGTL